MLPDLCDFCLEEKQIFKVQNFYYLMKKKSKQIFNGKLNLLKIDVFYNKKATFYKNCTTS
jgi:hypothetical protein